MSFRRIITVRFMVTYFEGHRRMRSILIIIIISKKGELLC